MILTAAQLTPSGRPVLQQGEVEVSLLDKVDLEFQPVGGLAGHQAEAYRNGYVILTNRRIIWVLEGSGDGASPAAVPAASSAAPGKVRAASLLLAAVVACHKKVQYSIKGAKVRLMLEVYTDRLRQPVPASGFHTSIDLLGLRCRGPAPDGFKVQLEEQVRQAVAADAESSTGKTTCAGTPSGSVTGGPSAASAVVAARVGSGQLDPHWSPLRAALQSRLGPLTAEGTPAGPGAGPVRAQSGLASSPPGMGPGPASAQDVGVATTSSAQGVAAELRPDPLMLQQMVEMGFPRNRAARSLLATQNTGTQEAIDYLLAFGDQAGMDEPLDLSPATATPASQAVGASASSAASPSPPAFIPTTSRYPGILPSSGPPTSGQASPYLYPYSPQSAAAAALRPYPHLYGSAPDLAGSGGASPSVSAALPTSTGTRASLDLAGQLPARTIGVAGIVKREQQKTEESGRAVEQAFRDLSALMSSAAAMVALAEKFRGVLGAEGSTGGAAGSTGTAGEDPLLMDLDTQQQLIALGISSPVTRQTAGARYHIELSRQLADFLATPLQRVGGLMSLPDVYCLFNRARGTELVSPDDLLQAAQLFLRAGVQGLRLRPLSSGVLVIQGPQHSEDQVCAKIAQLTTPSSPLLQDSTAAAISDTIAPPACGATAVPPPPPLGPGVSASDVALALGGISVAIASEHLLMAEARGVVCRDDGPEGLRFYRNFFCQDSLNPTALYITRTLAFIVTYIESAGHV
ncbi:hypothetical protein VOLCADRAFT_99928 [Volvox carteri f. nagariensis]|uniref:Vacuolar protein-sorting-associated protein 36 n=1 Tax=Volvox carteri f. nagariensis TaxID=3068 RepID=D8UJ01_VOLCA|nr:uncharacterized protein VOLCADRAFT_99928 [Volvox carteri f. nagariensis]EFJ40310.1 hypothetical protein VOLCADRAFT_99928 [Volvox carteri f. nagariensis]|eukprot:XP_002958644.1 hypothetical protein VOLCADRAFT_99928 [Volvox carteri f. nagariensis]